MGSKVKMRHPKKPRSDMAMDMILSTKGGPMRHRADRRPKENARIDVRDWSDDREDYDCEW